MKHTLQNVSWKRIGMELIGSILVAIGIYNFAYHAHFPMTGFSGIAIILNYLFEIPIGIATILLNIPVSILCFRLLGRSFFFRSMRCMILSSLMMDYLAPLLPVYEGSRLLAAICTGVISGMGYALIYMQNSSTGGSDFIVMAVKALRPHLSLGKIIFLSDLVITLAGGFIFRDVDGIIYGLIVNYLFSVMVDRIMYGMNSGKLTLIVTEHGQMICDIIDKCSGRGSTIIQAVGGYRQDKKDVVMCACNNKQMYQVQTAVKEADPNAFLIILESNEVHGEGFRTVQIGGEKK